MGEEKYRQFKNIRRRMMNESYKDEEVVQRLLSKVKDGTFEHSSKYEDIVLHIDLWWHTTSKNGKQQKYGIDVKNSKETTYGYGDRKCDVGSWIQIYARHEEKIKGWLYSEATYLAFLADDSKKVILVRPASLQKLYNERVVPLEKKNGYIIKTHDTNVVHYQPYIRDINSIFYVPQTDLELIADKIIVDDENISNQ